MNERTHTVKQIESLRHDLEGWIKITKHSDRAQIGVPDFSVCYEGRTFWVEVKYLRRGRSLRSELKPLQLEHLYQIEQTGNPAFVLVFTAEEKTTSIYTAGYLRHLFKKNNRLPPNVSGWQYSLLARKIYDYTH